MSAKTQEAKVVGIRDLSPSVRELTLSPLDWKVSFRPGQWVSLHLPVGQRPPLVRAYSMAEPESPSGRLVLAFDRVPQGGGSGYLFTLREGDTVVLAGSYGKFALPEPITRDLLFIARYTGIVPIRCMLKYLLTSHLSAHTTLIFEAPRQEDLIYQDEFVGLSAHHAAFHYVPLVLDQDEHGRGDYQPVIEKAASLVQGRKDLWPMIAGIRAFVQPLRAFFYELGYGRKEIRCEIYD